jgi:hypothetical protein
LDLFSAESNQLPPIESNSRWKHSKCVQEVCLNGVVNGIDDVKLGIGVEFDEEFSQCDQISGGRIEPFGKKHDIVY